MNTKLIDLGFSIGRYDSEETIEREELKRMLIEEIEAGYEVSVPGNSVVFKDEGKYFIEMQDIDHCGWGEEFETADEAVERFLEFTWE